MPITLFDGILIALMLLSGILAMIRGFSREVLSVASWVAAAAAAFYFYKALSPVVAPYLSSITTNQTFADVVAAGIIFLIALIIVSLITMRIADIIVDSRIGALDRTLGFVFGAARGMLLVVVGLLFYNWLVTEENQPSWVAEAKSKPMLQSIGDSIVQLVPEDPVGQIKERFVPEEGETGGEAAETEGQES